jgi:hypothetical protein
MKKYKLITALILLINNPLQLKAQNTISYSANLGGLRIAELTYSVNLKKEKWNIKTEILAAGIVDTFVSFVFSSESKGILINNQIQPELYTFSYEIKNKNKSRNARIKYREGIPVELESDPKYNDSDTLSMDELKKYGTNSRDPNSAFVVSGTLKNPCLENSKSFDGVRSYEIKMSKKNKKTKLIIDEIEYETFICMGSFNPIIGYEDSDFLETASERNSIRYWYSYFEKEKVWIPIKFIISTPLGALVVKANKIISNGEVKK